MEPAVEAALASRLPSLRSERLGLLETQVEEEAMVIVAIFSGLVLVGGVVAGLKSLVYSSEKPHDHFNVL
jgi:hypothetical protein